MKILSQSHYVRCPEMVSLEFEPHDCIITTYCCRDGCPYFISDNKDVIICNFDTPDKIETCRFLDENDNNRCGYEISIEYHYCPFNQFKPDEFKHGMKCKHYLPKNIGRNK